MSDFNIRIECELDIQSYLQNLNYALDHGATISFQIDRVVDDNRDIRHTNRYTVADMFPNEDPNTVLKRDQNSLI